MVISRQPSPESEGEFGLMITSKTSGSSKFFIWVLLEAFLLVVGFGLEEFAPHSWKDYGGAILITYVLSRLIYHACATLFSIQIANALLPYIITTYLALALVFLFAPVPYNHTGFVVFVALTGVMLFYWFVAIVVNATKKFLGIRKESENQCTD